MDCIDLVLIMTVEPGFGGQSFMTDMVPKIAEVCRMINAGSRPIHLEVDGGIDQETAPVVREAGANVLVAGTSVFAKTRPIAEAISRLRAGCCSP
jgi:ribulose-phosphate 3-epimerase